MGGGGGVWGSITGTLSSQTDLQSALNAKANINANTTGTSGGLAGNPSISVTNVTASGTIAVGTTLPSGAPTGTVAANAVCNWNGPIDVKACFGAKGDGTTIDSTAIQNAFDYADAGSIHPTVYFPSGVYIAEGLDLPCGPYIEGSTEGNGVILKLPPSTAASYLAQTAHTDGSCEYTYIEHMRFDGNVQNGSSVSIAVVSLQSSVFNQSEFSNSLVTNYTGAPGILIGPGTAGDGAGALILENDWVQTGGGANAPGIVISSFLGSNEGYVSGIRLHHVQIEGTGAQPCLTYQSKNPTKMRNNTVDDLWCGGFTGDGVYVNGLTFSQFSGVYFYAGGSPSTANSGIHIVTPTLGSSTYGNNFFGVWTSNAPYPAIQDDINSYTSPYAVGMYLQQSAINMESKILGTFKTAAGTPYAVQCFDSTGTAVACAGLSVSNPNPGLLIAANGQDGLLTLKDTRAAAQGVGGGWSGVGIYDVGGDYTGFGGFSAVKFNSTLGDSQGMALMQNDSSGVLRNQWFVNNSGAGLMNNSNTVLGYIDTSGIYHGPATSLSLGANGCIPYQTSATTTACLSGNTAATDNVLVSHGTGSAAQAPTLTNAPAISLANATTPAPTSSALASAPSGCSAGSAPTGVAANGNASGCTAYDPLGTATTAISGTRATWAATNPLSSLGTNCWGAWTPSVNITITRISASSGNGVFTTCSTSWPNVDIAQIGGSVLTSHYSWTSASGVVDSGVIPGGVAITAGTPLQFCTTAGSGCSGGSMGYIDFTMEYIPW
jgi:hypothetical protein